MKYVMLDSNGNGLGVQEDSSDSLPEGAMELTQEQFDGLVSGRLEIIGGVVQIEAIRTTI